MNTSWQRASGALGLVLALGVGCGDDGMTTTDAGVDSGPVPVDDGGVDSGTDAGPEPGRAGLTFTSTLGRDSKDQFDSAAMPFIPEDTSSDRGDLLILLCATDDAECAEPIVRLVDQANPDEWPTDVGGPAPLQESFGPEITVTDLPAGTYDVMVVYDSLDSQRRGFGWDDDFETVETAWGGIVSETDRMMSTGMPGDTSNPLPETTEVTLVDGETQDLGTITLSHYHERAISMRPAADTGLLVIGNKTDNTIRLLDLETYELVAAGRGVDFPLTDGDAEIRGSLCNVIEGHGGTRGGLRGPVRRRDASAGRQRGDLSGRSIRLRGPLPGHLACERPQ